MLYFPCQQHGLCADRSRLREIPLEQSDLRLQSQCHCHLTLGAHFSQERQAFLQARLCPQEVPLVQDNPSQREQCAPDLTLVVLLSGQCQALLKQSCCLPSIALKCLCQRRPVQHSGKIWSVLQFADHREIFLGQGCRLHHLTLRQCHFYQTAKRVRERMLIFERPVERHAFFEKRSDRMTQAQGERICTKERFGSARRSCLRLWEIQGRFQPAPSLAPVPSYV